MGSSRADSEAPTTTDTSVREKHNFRFKPNAFRILTPKTVKRTALEKNCCPDAWPVMNREALNIKDSSLHLISHSSSDWLIHFSSFSSIPILLLNLFRNLEIG